MLTRPGIRNCCSREALLRPLPGFLPSLHFQLISAKDTAVCPAEDEEHHESSLSAFPMTCLDLAQFLLLRRMQGRERSPSCTPAGADMRNRRQVEMQGPAKPEAPQMCTEKGKRNLKCTTPRSSLAPARLVLFFLFFILWWCSKSIPGRWHVLCYSVKLDQQLYPKELISCLG